MQRKINHQNNIIMNRIKKIGIGIKAGGVKDLTGFCKSDTSGVTLLRQSSFQSQTGERLCTGLRDGFLEYPLMHTTIFSVSDDEEVWLAEYDSDGKNVVQADVVISSFKI